LVYETLKVESCIWSFFTNKERGCIRFTSLVVHNRDPPNQKAVNQYSLDGVFVATHTSASAAARAIGGDLSAISSCCSKKRNSHKEFIWKHATEAPDISTENAPPVADDGIETTTSKKVKLN
jgi:hypothetical protein